MLFGIAEDEPVGLLPASGPKGSGLAMIVDILGSLLADMPWGPHINRMYGDIESPRRLGHFFMAIDIRRFMPLDTFVKKMDAMLEELIAQEPAKGFERVCYPGQLEGERRAKSQKEGILLEPCVFRPKLVTDSGLKLDTDSGLKLDTFCQPAGIG